MNKIPLLLVLLVLIISGKVQAGDCDLISKTNLVSKHITQQKNIDNGGSGPYKAIAVTPNDMPDFVVYRPISLAAAVQKEQPLPVIIHGNGACANTSAGYERMLINLASHGYLVIAIGEMQQVYGDRTDTMTSASMMQKAIDWICQEVKDPNSDYYQMADTTRMAAQGHSCGGAQTLSNAANSHLRTYMILNAGMGDMEMADASAASLQHLHGPILYLTGGPDDVAYHNAQLDYDRIDRVPVVLADLSTAGHGGTYSEPLGGDFGRMVLAWADWQLKGKGQGEDIFICHDLSQYPGWTIKHKNFGDLRIPNGDHRQIYGILHETSRTIGGKKGVAIISHGFNGTHHFAEDYYQTLSRLGYKVYAFDYPCGSIYSRSDNNTVNMSVLDQKDDLKAVTRYFQQQPDVDPDRIVLIGESQGGFISAITAAELKEQIQAMVLIYPALCIPDNWNQRYPQPQTIPDTTMLWNVPLGARFFRELRGINTYDIIGQYEGPVLIVQGDKDEVVSVEYAHQAKQTYKHATLKIIEGAGHGFKPAEREVSNQHVSEFLKQLPVSKSEFVRGADIGMLPMQELRGQQFHDTEGNERECLDLLKDYQIGAVRLRVWINPQGGYSGKESVLKLAKRAQAEGMDIMIAFHYSNSWSDPGHQPIPKEWTGHSFKQLKRDIALHTTEVLSYLKDNGITPKWIQIGNETSNGMMWNVKTDEQGNPIKDEYDHTTMTYSMGHIDHQPKHYAQFIGSAYKAAKKVFPQSVVIVHLDNGFDQALYDRNLGIVLKYGGNFDMIGMSLYPYWAIRSKKEPNAEQTITDGIANIRHLYEKFGKDVMIVETGFEVDESRPELMEEGGRYLARVIREAQTQTDGHCKGVFYWEPQCTPGGYKLGAFDSNGAPTAIMKGFITQ